MKMSDIEIVYQFIDKLMEFVFCMKFCGWEVEDKEVVQKIFFFLFLRFNEVLVEEVEIFFISDFIDFLLVYEYYMELV